MLNLNQPQFCMVCEQKTRTPYGRWVAGITCSNSCNQKHVEQLRKALHEKQLQVTQNAKER